MAENTQKIELLEKQCKEYRERENSLKLLNNSIMLALNDLSAQNEKNARKQLSKDLEFLQKKSEYEMRELKTQHENQMKSLQIRVNRSKILPNFFFSLE